MTTCEFIRISENLVRCARCGTSIEILDNIDSMPFFPCGSAISDLFKNDRVDTTGIKKQASQMPTENQNVSEECSDSEIETRFAICKSCQYFNNNTCTECGCVLSRDRVFLNKLTWKDQSCPIGKW